MTAGIYDITVEQGATFTLSATWKDSNSLVKVPKPGAKMVPDGVAYDRIGVFLIDQVKKIIARVEKLESK